MNLNQLKMLISTILVNLPRDSRLVRRAWSLKQLRAQHISPITYVVCLEEAKKNDSSLISLDCNLI